MFNRSELSPNFCFFFIAEKLQVVDFGLLSSGIHSERSEKTTSLCRLNLKNVHGGPLEVKLFSSTGFFQRIAASHERSLMMPGWGFLNWRMGRWNTYNLFRLPDDFFEILTLACVTGLPRILSLQVFLISRNIWNSSVYRLSLVCDVTCLVDASSYTVLVWCFPCLW